MGSVRVPDPPTARGHRALPVSGPPGPSPVDSTPPTRSDRETRRRRGPAARTRSVASRRCVPTVGRPTSVPRNPPGRPPRRPPALRPPDPPGPPVRGVAVGHRPPAAPDLDDALDHELDFGKFR